MRSSAEVRARLERAIKKLERAEKRSKNSLFGGFMEIEEVLKLFRWVLGSGGGRSEATEG